MTNVSLCNLLVAAGSSHSQPLYADLEATVCPLKHVGKSTRGNVALADVELRGR